MRIALDLQPIQSTLSANSEDSRGLRMVRALINSGSGDDYRLLVCGIYLESVELIRGYFENLTPTVEIKVWSPLGLREDYSRPGTWWHALARISRSAVIESMEVDATCVFMAPNSLGGNAFFWEEIEPGPRATAFSAESILEFNHKAGTRPKRLPLSIYCGNFPLGEDYFLASSQKFAQELCSERGVSPEKIVVPNWSLSDERTFQLEATGERNVADLEAWGSSAANSLATIVNSRSSDRGVSSVVATLRQARSNIHGIVKQVFESIDVGFRTAPNLAMVANSLVENFPLARKKVIYIDISELVQRDSKTGIQRVVRSIAHWLLQKNISAFDVNLVYSSQEPDAGYRHAANFTAKFQGSNGEDSHVDEQIEPQLGDIFLGLDLQPHVVLAQQKYYQRLRVAGVKVYFVVYDILPIRLERCFPVGAKHLHESWLGILSDADGLLCISRAVADEVIDWLTVCRPPRRRPLKIGWFHLGADVESSVPSTGVPSGAASLMARLKKSPSFLMVGTLEPRKGHSQVIAAFERLWAKGASINLVIVGKLGWNVDELQDRIQNHPEKDIRLYWLSGVSDEYLAELYGATSCLIAGSEGEGFGLPLIEAAQHKKPIICRDLPVFREVAGNGAHYFSGETAESLEKSLLEWLALSSAGKIPDSGELNWLTWEQSADAVLEMVLTGKWYSSLPIATI